MKESDSKLNELKSIVKDFIEDRKWSNFMAKKLSYVISIGKTELMELFQVIIRGISKGYGSGVFESNAIDEIADVLIYAFILCNQNNIDIYDAIKQKLKNIKKYQLIVMGNF